jgi:ABC-2 type transport system ATP-binding protein
MGEGEEVEGEEDNGDNGKGKEEETMKTIIEVENLVKRYGPITAVDDISFEVYEGEIFCMVGPNGAGKTTTIECIEGLRVPDSGKIIVLGLDPQRDKYDLKERIGVQLQESQLYDRIRVREALELFSSFYRRSVPWEPILERLGLAHMANSYYANLSHGQKQRLAIALSLVNDAEIVFLDELTTGLDPQARRAMWDLVRDIRDRGKTVFLTTHYMEEAERLSDRVLIIDYGKIVALDTPEKLIRNLGAERRVIFTTEEAFEPEPLKALPSVTRVEQIGERVIVYGRGDGVLPEVVRVIEAKGWRVRDLRSEQATLDDVFLALTGREMRD